MTTEARELRQSTSRAGIEYCVKWKRVGLTAKRKRYASLKAAQRWTQLLGPEPWLALGKNADALVCCSGDRYSECGCGGLTWREQADDKRREMPALEYVQIDVREVGPWLAI